MAILRSKRGANLTYRNRMKHTLNKLGFKTV